MTKILTYMKSFAGRTSCILLPLMEQPDLGEASSFLKGHVTQRDKVGGKNMSGERLALSGHQNSSDSAINNP
ncbi:Uncharacterized protein HZ326_20448 [Fusarium oxysporum f. sp. albedinis]|nr:hypothetical protein HZ326_20897 [Fusarium oxysporum f. sp. albedinis]KAJ0136541.1 Uncharacterized protein HZ326_20448 [Fusarium oxysporum f. sp. albedinis]